MSLSGRWGVRAPTHPARRYRSLDYNTMTRDGMRGATIPRAARGGTGGDAGGAVRVFREADPDVVAAGGVPDWQRRPTTPGPADYNVPRLFDLYTYGLALLRLPFRWI